MKKNTKSKNRFFELYEGFGLDSDLDLHVVSWFFNQGLPWNSIIWND